MISMSGGDLSTTSSVAVSRVGGASQVVYVGEAAGHEDAVTSQCLAQRREIQPCGVADRRRQRDGLGTLGDLTLDPEVRGAGDAGNLNLRLAPR